MRKSAAARRDPGKRLQGIAVLRIGRVWSAIRLNGGSGGRTHPLTPHLSGIWARHRDTGVIWSPTIGSARQERSASWVFCEKLSASLSVR